MFLMHPVFNQQSIKDINKYFHYNMSSSKTSWAASAEDPSECHKPRSRLLTDAGRLSRPSILKGIRDRDRTCQYIFNDPQK